MWWNRGNSVKKREKSTPADEFRTNTSRERNDPPNRGQTPPRSLPIGLPIVQQSRQPSRYSCVYDDGGTELKKFHKRRSLDNIDFHSDNETLDVRNHRKTLEAVKDIEPHNDKQDKRRYSVDTAKSLRQSSSKTSLRSLASPDSSKSYSLNSLSSSYGADITDYQMVDQEDIINLTVHVRQFSDAINNLRSAFSSNVSDTDSDENHEGETTLEKYHAKVHKCLADVLFHLKEVIHRFPSMKTNEILNAAGILIRNVKNLSHVDRKNPDEFNEVIDQLALIFSSSISDLLTGDQEQEPNHKTGDDGEDGDDYTNEDEEGSEGDILSENMSLHSRQNSGSDVLNDKDDVEIDEVLLKMEAGVDFCLQWTKYWSKYVKDIANYVEKRAQLEAEYTKQLTKLAQATRAAISEESNLPFQSTFITALEQDMEYAQKCQQTLVAISGSKFMEPIMQRRSVHDRARKDMKDEWAKTRRQLHDSANTVKTTENNYHKRYQDLEKLNPRQGDVKEISRDDSFSVFSSNKGKKEEELRGKMEEAQQLYNSAIKVANNMQKATEKTKIRIVSQTKQLVNECDRTFRSVTRKYFDMMHELAVPVPIHYKTLAESCQGYDPGKAFENFVRFHQSAAIYAVNKSFEFRPYGNGRFGHELESPVNGSAMDTMSDFPGGRVSPTLSPSSSPKTKRPPRIRPPKSPSSDDESEGETRKPKSVKNSKTSRQTKNNKQSKGPMTKEAATHTFHKMRTPGKCAVCDTYAFIGLECAQCGLVFHKKCLENIKTLCTRSRILANTKELPSPMKTFGVRFSEDGGVPVLVSKCVKEINRRGLRVKGIYRVSGVKSKMENLCQEFETNAESVDLSTQPPHLIASVLKLYIRQLPEPLMTTKLYSELIQLAKESDHLPHLRIDDCEPETKEEFRKFLDKLQETIKKLPRSNYLTTATLIKHLHKVSLHEEYNQMNSNNLAIVFGPTILRLESTIPGSSLSSLVDMSHQSRIVALLIVNPQLFDDVPDEPDDELENASIEENDSSLPSSPVEKFVLIDSKDENGVCNIDSETWVGDEVPSPKEHRSFQLTDISSTRRAQIFDTMRISESDIYEGKAAISLLGSSEEKDTNFDFPVNRKISSERDTEPSSYYSKQTDVVQNGVLDENSFVSSYEDSSTLSSVGSLSNQNSTEFQTSKRGDDSEVELPQSNFGSTKDKMDFDGNLPRRRSKAFSAGNKNSEMLAKRGSALMNTYIVENNTSTVESNNQEEEISLENQSNGELLVIASETNSNEATDSDITPVQTETEGQVVSGKSPFLEMKAPIALRSENQVNINTLYKNTPSRKRNATYEIDRRRNGTSRPEKTERHFAGDRVYGTRARHTRVSVKDQIKQLESREQKDSSTTKQEGVRSSKKTPSDIVEDSHGVQGTTIDLVDGKENVSDNSMGTGNPIIRDYPTRDISGIFQPPKVPVSKYKTGDDKFCAVKRDINLDSPQTQTSDSSEIESDNVGTEASLLPTWKGQGLTPRDSKHAPEFV